MKLQQIAVVSKQHINIHNFNNLVDPILKLLPFVSFNFYTKRVWKSNHKIVLQQNTVCLEQKIYASQENFYIAAGCNGWDI